MLAKGEVVVVHRQIQSDDPLARDHVVHGLPLLPAAGHLALVHDALVEIFGDVPFALSRVVFLRPVFVERREELQIAITSQGDGRYGYEVRTAGGGGKPEIHSRGEAAPLAPRDREEDAPPPKLAVEEIRARCPGRVDRRSHYRRFDEMSVLYGPFFSTVEEIRHNETEVLATLVHDGGEQALPGCFDGAVQALAPLDDSGLARGPQVPFAMHKIQIWREIPTCALAWVRVLPNSGASIECELVIADLDGEVCARIDGLVTRELKPPTDLEKPSPAPALEIAPAPEKASPAPAPGVEARIVRLLSEGIARALGRADADLDPEAPFTDYGVDSIILVELVNALNAQLGIELKTTALFDHPSVAELARFVSEEFRGQIAPAPAPDVESPAPDVESAAPDVRSPAPVQGTPRAQEVSASVDLASRRQIAVVGLSCRFAGARSAREFWQNLAAGKCGIREVPKERWDADALYDPDPRAPGKTNCKWGGFVDDVDAFDPLFFNLSGREAELTDPQQRLFLEECWRALEDSGYAGDAVSGLRCGVFAGVPGSDYAALLHAAGADDDAQAMMGNDTAILPARISYFLNLKGPSLAINTACSSSLVAVDLACRSIETGQCEMALAGGVCLFVTPSFHVSSAKAGMLSPDGLCKAFDQSANGFVPGDGVGVVVLKSLERAKLDGDHIYGVILGSDTNQDGKTNGLTAPSSVSQTAVQIAAYERAGIQPDTIQLIEAHGTGTKLGDPIEIAALARSFAKYTQEKQFCAIGSVKTNIGHTGQAAGIAGLIKLLLALEQEMIPPTLHLSEENERIAFRETPFYPVTSPTPWRRREGRPRRAAVSSFGYSGTNAHVVVEEAPRSAAGGDEDGRPRLVLLSGKTPEALAQRLEELAVWLAEEGREASLADIAYTLHAGRKHWSERIAFVVNSVAELEGAIRGARARGAAAGLPPRLTPAEKEQRAETLRRSMPAASSPASRDTWLREAADLYVRGLAIDVDLVFPQGKGRRLSMPTYPFARERYWVTAPAAPAAPAISAAKKRYPLLSEDAPGRFVFDPPRDAFLRTDHVVGGKSILAAMVSVELARAAVALSGDAGGAAVTIRDVSWRRPLRVDAPSRLELRLTRQEDAFRFELDDAPAEGGRAQPPAASGFVTIGGAPAALERLELDSIRRRCTSSRAGADCYEQFRAIGFDYGPGFRVIADLAMNDDEVLARLELPEPLLRDASDFVLHPALLDGALQAMLGLAKGEADPSVPCGVAEIAAAGALPRRCIAHVVRTGESTVDVRVADETGRVLVAIRDLMVARVRPAPASVARGSEGLVALRPVWRARARARSNEPNEGAGPTLLLDGEGGAIASLLRAKDPSRALIRVVAGPRFLSSGKDDYEIDPAFADDWSRLVDAIGAPPGRVLITWNPGGRETVTDSPDLTLGFATVLHAAQALMRARPKRAVDIAVAVPVHEETAPPHLAALGAFARSLRAEHSDIRIAVVGLPAARFADHVHALLAETDSVDAPEVRYLEDGSRWVRELEDTSLPEPAPERSAMAAAVRDGGMYVLTGGLGGVGFVLARYLASRKAKLVLIGRAALDASRQTRIAELERLGAEVLYERADVADRQALARALDAGRRRFGAIHGIVHLAGVVKDAFVMHKTLSDAREVLRPKIDGAIGLDLLTREDPLEFFALFSSAVAVTGNVGQADYAFANAFLGELSHQRETLRREGKRSGKTIAIDWGAWERGMQASADTLEELRSSDVIPLDDAQGVAGFVRALAFAGPEVVILAGHGGARGSLVRPNEAHPKEIRPSASGTPSPELQREIETYLKELLATELRVPAARIDATEPLETYGIDSVMVMRLSRRIEVDFGELPKTLFFEYQNLRDLSEYFVERHGGEVQRIARRKDPLEPKSAPTPIETRASVPSPSAALVAVDAPAGSRATVKEAAADLEIAIVGVAGRYPMADDLDSFWSNLAEGRDCITEIPEDRWKLDGFFSSDKATRGKSYSKWGGFLRGIDEFDPLFFNVSPIEADMMAPQERIFLETVWQLIESSGYTRASFRDRKTGVFVGVMYGQYQFFSSTDGRVGVSSHASIANRVSYFFNFRGPSIALDTMCSSSLTALHLACESIKRGECEVAVAGGVNVSIHPQKYLQLSLGQFASTDGRCRSFGDGGDGYVPGEGVGALLLKPLAKALADGDTIHAIVRGSAINHGGKTNGYTVPNPHAQAAAIAEALEKTGIPADHVSYVEAHGTGTALGDPIEIAALTKAYSSIAKLANHTPIGSVKSSIGHLESAAGIAAITKVLLQMRHGMLAPSLHADRVNPNIDFARSPFFVQRELAPWNRPAITEGASSRTLPRIAGVSSFGAGGANAHVILEEWSEPTPPSAEQPPSAGAELVLVSAKDAPRLAALARALGERLRASCDPAQARSDGAPAEARGWRGHLEADLLQRACRLLGVPPGQIGLEDDLQDCGLDGVVRAQLDMEIVEAYGLAGPLEPSAGLESLGALAAALASRTDVASRFDADASVATRAIVRDGSPLRLADVAYTLMVGREAMEQRVAFVARDLADAAQILEAVARGDTLSGVARGQLRAGEPWSMVFDGNAGGEYLAALVREGALDRIARHWVEGAPVDWSSLHPGPRKPRRVPLPTHPFARERHWLPVMHDRGGAVEVTSETRETRETSETSETRETSEMRETREHDTATNGAAAPIGFDVQKDPRRELVRELIAASAPILGLAPERMDPMVNFGDYGFESVALKDLAVRISETFGVTIKPTIFFERPNLDGIASWLLEEHEAAVRARYEGGGAEGAEAPAVANVAHAMAGARLKTRAPEEPDDEPIAIIGMSGRFAGSPTLRDFWKNLEAGRDLVTEIPEARWNWRDYDNDELPAQERCTSRWGSFIDDVDMFDPLFFGISPAEAEVMDPQARIFLETVWHGIEDAGYRPSDFSGTNVGLFAGVQFSDYQHLMHEANFLNAQAGIGNEHSIVLNRISYLLNLRGPSEPVNTACSSSLVAVHRAVRSLRSGESSVAIAGGMALNLAPHSTVAAGMMGLLSPDGKCKTLDKSANGYVKGEGVAAIVLKPLRKAMMDGDHVYAVIRGTAVNHGGRAASLTAPNSEAQASLVVRAIEEAGIPHDTIGYIELHGTGTELGDPVEINGLRSAFRQLAKKSGTPLPQAPHCGLGSVKTNIGHLEPASGIAGMIKVILAMHHATLPATLHLTEINPYVDLADGRFYVVDRKMPWQRLQDASGQPLPRRAGVSSFGFGGVNAHVVLEEFVAPPIGQGPRDPSAKAARGDEDRGREHVFVFSAKTEAALEESVRAMLRRMAEWQEDGSVPPLADVVYTLQLGREAHKERLACIAGSYDELRDRLDGYLGGRPSRHVHRGASSGHGGELSAAPHVAALAEHWVAGGKVDWSSLHAGRKRVPLPTYAFGRKRYWFHDGPTAAPSRAKVIAQTAAGAASDDDGGELLAGEDYVRAELRVILLEKLKLEDRELDDDANLADFGVDSMLGAMIMQIAQEKFGSQIPLSAAAEYPTLRALARYIHDEFFDGTAISGRTKMQKGAAPAAGAPLALGSKKAVKFPPELLPMNMKGSKPPSFWVHGATGYSVWFQNLSDWLGPDYPIYAFQAKGTDGRSMPHTLDEMVDHYIACIRMVQPKGPYIIGGYSFGGVPAMEMARRLAEQGEEIQHLIMFDTYPATEEVFQRHFGPYDDDFLPLYLANFVINVDENPELVIRKEDVAHVPKRLLVNELARLAKERGKKRMSVEDIYLYLKGGLLVSENAEGIYQLHPMRPYDASDVLFFRAMDGFTGRATEKYWPPTNILKGYDYTQPWRDIIEVDANGAPSGRKLKVVELDNDHMNMLSEPTLTVAAREVEQILRRPPPFDMEEYLRFNTAFQEVNRFGYQLLADRMRAVLPPANQSTTRQEIHEKLKVQPRYNRLSNANIDILDREGYVRIEGDRITVTEKLAEPLFPGAEEEIRSRAEDLQAQFPAAKDYVPLLTTCQAAVLEVIEGTRDPVDVIFPGGSMKLVAELYKGNLQTDYYNKMVADRVGEFVHRRLRKYKHSKVQLFEVGAGTGGTSVFIFDAVKEHASKVRYVYTDVGAGFVQMSKQQFAPQFPFVEFTPFDVEKSGDVQGFEPHTMDVVIASNVLHTTRDIHHTLAQCRRLLKPKGIIVINELTQRLDYNTLTFGLTPGWWLYEDEDERISGSPLLKNYDWVRILEEVGFESAEVTGMPGTPVRELEQSIIVAVAAG
ncbi:SDR family NAD(P)-dependent oxidoreductase [Pendulispora albinea]|uniref:SDR family NAD(P)-dependent oxidoreductase n=1 Tax=Pendulispora albinea TaxID=2741071 RepID=A0ABZ2MB64_9BACT